MFIANTTVKEPVKLNIKNEIKNLKPEPTLPPINNITVLLSIDFSFKDSKGNLLK